MTLVQARHAQRPLDNTGTDYENVFVAFIGFMRS
jgi:hypothetical protein